MCDVQRSDCFIKRRVRLDIGAVKRNAQGHERAAESGAVSHGQTSVPVGALCGLHASDPIAWTAVSACSRPPCVFGLLQEPVVPSAAAISWMTSASAGLTLCPPSLCAAATLFARARTKCR